MNEKRSTGLLFEERFARHRPPAGHVERPERIETLADLVRKWTQDPRFQRVPARPASDDELRRVHSEEHIAQVVATRGRSLTILDPDTFAGEETEELARLAAGGCAALALELSAGRLQNAIALVRPPGHHAERHRPMGFCFYNNVAVAAAAVRAAGCARVAIVDWDVHHGNGTQEIFEEDPNVYFASMHQWPFYPGTGAAHENGLGAGRGATLNVPMTAGAGDEEWLGALCEMVVPAVEAFRPEMIFISAGFDAHSRDPLGEMQVSTEGFRAMAQTLLGLAGRTSGGKVLAVLEGGYDLQALRESVEAVGEVFAGAGASQRSELRCAP